ncbi:MAG: hypothetical protein WCY29_07330 [Novosphingobium sp.]
MSANADRYFELVLSAAKMGAVMSPIGWRLAPAEAAYILRDCQAKILRRALREPFWQGHVRRVN